MISASTLRAIPLPMACRRRRHGNRLDLTVADDGQGFEPDAVPVEGTRKSFGLASMRERAASLDGELTLDSRPGGGTRIVVSVQLKRGTGGSKGGSLAPAAR